MGLGKWESFLGNHIEGFFNRKFSSALEPVELVRALEQEMKRSMQKSGDEMLLPNDYWLMVGEEDYQRLCAERILNLLYETAERKVIREDCFLDGKLTIRLGKQEGCKGVKIQSSMEKERTDAGDEEPHTLVLERRKFAAPLNLPKDRELAVLQVTEGPDQDSRLVIGEKQIYMGRREKSDFILTDTNASRMHAYISYERHRHVLHDAGSLNGTYVNHQRVEHCWLCYEDEIQIGNTTIIYGVV